MTQIMYVCDRCAEESPEFCGHYDRGELIVAKGMTLCIDCFNDLVGSEDGSWPDLPAPIDLGRLLMVCRAFVNDHRISCPEATCGDRVYEHAPELVEKIADVIGYWVDPDDA